MTACISERMKRMSQMGLAARYGNQTESQRFWKYVDKTHGCWEWSGSLDNFGYGQFSIGRSPKRRTIKAHRWSWENSNGPTVGMCVLHRCDNRKCVNPAHLFLGTRSDNMRDMHAKGRGNCWGHKL